MSIAIEWLKYTLNLFFDKLRLKKSIERIYMSLEIDSFILTSSTEVQATVLKVKNIQKKSLLFHIVSYMHNTVLVQNLKLELEKVFPHAKIVLLKVT